MTFRDISDLVRASNNSTDLSSLIKSYLVMWRKHANGVDGITIPDEKFDVLVTQPKEDGVCFKIVYVRVENRSIAQYYDVDDDYYTEGFGACNISHYISKSVDHLEEKELKIRFGALLQTEENMLKSIKQSKKRFMDTKEEAAKKEEITELKERLKVLESN